MAKPALETSAAVDTRMADIEHTQNAEDVAGFTCLFSPDATWVTGGGQRPDGIRAIPEWKLVHRHADPEPGSSEGADHLRQAMRDQHGG